MPRRYLIIFFSIWLGGMAIIAAFNWGIDPYNMFPSPKVAGFNMVKPDADDRQRMSKAYGVSRSRPTVVILGTSRAMAIATNHPVWKSKKVYNLALASATLYEMYRYLQHANADATVHEVVIGLDWFAFADSISNSEYAESRMQVASDGSRQLFNLKQYFQDILPSLWSNEALGASISTWRSQPDGLDLELLSAQRKNQRIRDRNGNRAMFRDFENLTLASESFTSVPQQLKSSDDTAGTQTFRELLRYAYAQHIDIRFFISPSHARLWEVWRLTGKWDRIDAWKHRLVQILQEEAQRAHADVFPLWDFSGYNAVTMEPVPIFGDVDHQMQWYWEDSHYTEALGEYLLDRIYDYHSPQRTVWADFGVKLNSQNIESVLTSVRSGHADYLRHFPTEVHEVESIYQQALMFHQNRFQH